MSVTEPVRAALRFDLTRNGQSPEMAKNCHLRVCRSWPRAASSSLRLLERANIPPQIEDRVPNTLVDQTLAGYIVAPRKLRHGAGQEFRSLRGATISGTAKPA